METPGHNSPEVLREEILGDARRESAEIVERAWREAQAVLAEAAAAADKARQARLSQARAEALRRTELILATVLVEAGRARLARVEALIESVREEVRQRLTARDGYDYRETVVALAADAIKQMPGSTFAVRLSAADRVALGDGLAGEIAARVGRSPLDITISGELSETEAGLVIQDTEGCQEWDNRLSARLDRFWPALRQDIALRAALVGGSRSIGGGA